MLTCDQTADLLLDYLYDLLDEEDAGKLREHLAACPACQAALAAAEAQQHLLARAAQIYAEVPAFTAPSAAPSAPVETIQPAPAAVPQAPATLPLPPSPQTKPRRLLRWLAAAAVLFVAAGGAFGFIQYQNGWTERRAELARVRHEINAIERQQLPSVEQTYRAQKAALPAQLKANYLQVQVSGPANYERDAASRYQVATRDLESKPIAATVIAQLKLPGQEQPVFEQKLAIPGDGIVTLPAGLAVPPDTLPYLQVKAQRETALAEVPQLLPVAEPAYVSHLALSKSTYRVGDILFFRSLTVHRFSLQPVRDEFEIACTLLGPNEQPLRTVHAVVHQGVAGGEIALTGDLPAGEYSLRIEERDSRKPMGPGPWAPARSCFPPESRRLTIVREESPQLRFDRPLYGSGDTVNAAVRGSLRNGMVVPNQPITVEAEYGGRPLAIPGAAPGKPLQTTTDDYGKAAFHVPLPATMAMPMPMAETLRITVQAHDGKADPKVAAAIPVLPQPAGILTVELFPEGGDLVAGVPSRVYFRAIDHHNQPALLTGVLLDRQGRELVAVRGTEAGGVQGLGSFEFTPEAGETYTLRGRAPGTIETRVQLPPTRADGVALSVPQAVQHEGQSLRVMVRDPRGRRLLVLAECRGRIVDQAFLTADKAGTEATLTPVSGTRGVVRVMVVELSEGRLVPLAERLVYRTPADYLQLTVSDSTGQTPTVARAGEHLGLTVKVTNEKDAPTQASLLAAFVDRKWLGQRAEVTPPAQFYLSRPVSHPEDLADVDILFADTPQARQALDLFLATHGWRRFVPPGEPNRPDPSEKEVLAAMDAGQPAVFITDNRLEAAAEYQKKLATRQKALQDQAERQRAELAVIRDGKLKMVEAAAAALREYEDLPRRSLQGVLVGVVLTLFTLGSLGLALGVARTVRGGKSPRGSFAVAFVALFLCAGAYFWTMSLRDGQPEGGPLADLGKRELPPLDVGALGGRGEDALKQGEATSVRKLFALTSESKTVARRDAPTTSGVMSAALTAGEKAPSAPLVAYAPGHADQENAAFDRQRNNPDYARRFAELQRTQQLATVATDPHAAKGGAALAPAPVAPTFVPSIPLAKPGGNAKSPAKGDSKRAGEEGSRLPLREYKHKQAAGVLDFQETLFWHPALEAKDGTARLEFDLSNNATTYQLLLYGHTSSGRLGVYRATVETRR